MPQKDYRAYAQTPAGQAARARARAKYLQQRRERRQANTPMQINPQPLAQAVSNWRTH